jgi:hypothetical protein
MLAFQSVPKPMVHVIEGEDKREAVWIQSPGLSGFGNTIPSNCRSDRISAILWVNKIMDGADRLRVISTLVIGSLLERSLFKTRTARTSESKEARVLRRGRSSCYKTEVRASDGCQ